MIIVLTVLLVLLGGVAFIVALSIKTVLASVFFSIGGFAVFWGIFIQMRPTMIALYRRRSGKLTPEELAIEMAARSDQELLDKFPRVFDMTDEQQRELFPSALAMFPEGFERSLETLGAARKELQNRNIPIPQVDFQPLQFMELKETRHIKQVLRWCIFTALFCLPVSLYVIFFFKGGMVHGESHMTFNAATIIIRIATTIVTGISVLGVIVIPCVLVIQLAVFRERRRKVAALSEAIANSQRDTTLTR